MTLFSLILIGELSQPAVATSGVRAYQATVVAENASQPKLNRIPALRYWLPPPPQWPATRDPARIRLNFTSELERRPVGTMTEMHGTSKCLLTGRV
eukprot:COSAG01_NODE_47297_length_391_cov_8.719178_1_plen_95_part_10